MQHNWFKDTTLITINVSCNNKCLCTINASTIEMDTSLEQAGCYLFMIQFVMNIHFVLFDR